MRRRGRRWRVILAYAACLALAVVAVSSAASALFAPPELVLSPEERARVSLAWDEVFGRFAERRRARTTDADPSK